MRKKLIDTRIKKDMKVKEIANDLGISESFYYKIESGIRNPNFILTKKIADYFGEDIDALFYEENLDSSSTSQTNHIS